MSQKVGRNFFAIITEGHTPALTAGQIDLSPQYIVEKAELDRATFIAPVAGVPGFLTTTIGGAYTVGDTVRLTIVSNLTSRQLWRKSYAHVVQAGATGNAAIAAALGAQIQADVDPVSSPYASVGVVAAVITVTQIDDDKRGLTAYDFTDSAAGTIVTVPTATVISEGQPSDLVDRGIDASLINLASYDTVRIALDADTAIPYIDSNGKTSREIFWYGTPGEGGPLETLINT